ncbi:hypothetical protein [Wolinella succinogenes]|uniref:hypothetical protein n=1 Tax=Wolinella succinogenes TaxID=844 RepID=UPI001E50136E|nr:hypothetical protein [Wolinella succinogenes]
MWQALCHQEIGGEDQESHVTLFWGNAFKLKTLECCPDCKVKVMVGFSSEADSKRETILEEVE